MGAVPESILKKRKRNDEWAVKKAAAADVAKKEAKAKRKVIFKRAEQYVKEYRDQVRGPPAWMEGAASFTLQLATVLCEGGPP